MTNEMLLAKNRFYGDVDLLQQCFQHRPYSQRPEIRIFCTTKEEYALAHVLMPDSYPVKVFFRDMQTVSANVDETSRATIFILTGLLCMFAIAMGVSILFLSNSIIGFALFFSSCCLAYEAIIVLKSKNHLKLVHSLTCNIKRSSDILFLRAKRWIDLKKHNG